MPVYTARACRCFSIQPTLFRTSSAMVIDELELLPAIPKRDPNVSMYFSFHAPIASS